VAGACIRQLLTWQLLLLLLLLLQLWNLPWWSCSAGSCVDRNIDEVAYIETIIKTILSKLSVDKSKVGLL
jgi:poly(3-hydroxybutyrate) depolymerase